MTPVSPDTQSPLSEADAVQLDPDYLRQTMADSLSQRDVVFAFRLQRRPPGASDDPTELWDEAQSPPVTAGRLVIKSQTFTSPEQMKRADEISFNPWHSLQDHRPRGSVNEARRDVYLEMLRFRRSQNRVALPERSDEIGAGRAAGVASGAG